MKKVTKHEFNEFIDNYPNPIKTGLTAICEPPIRDYFDDTLGGVHMLGTLEHFQDICIAKVVLDWLSDDGKTSEGDDYYTYHIKEQLLNEVI